MIYCAGKADEHLLHIFERLYKADGQVFGTRATQHQYEILREKYPQVEYDPISHIIKIEKKDKEHIGNIAVCTAGTGRYCRSGRGCTDGRIFWNESDEGL